MKKTEIAKTIIYGLATVGLVTMAITIPNMAVAFRDFYKPLRQYEQAQVKRAFKYLFRKKLIGTGEKRSKTVVVLTKAGKEKLLRYKLDDLKIKPHEKWDGKFRLVIFDIPEKYRYARQIFSAKLREIGFAPWQKSAWICPHPCQDEIDFLVSVYEIYPFVKTLTIDSSELEYGWQKKFNLSKI
ncbi:MAG: hypothetical protein Q8P83_01475 [bacterium]|nr:hypothetical protein [bacterium]